MMKIELYITAILLVPVVAAAQKQGYTLKGKFADPQTRGKIYVSYYENQQNKRDSTELKNGAFEIRGSVEGPTSAWMDFKPEKTLAKKKGHDGLSLYLDQGLISISIKDSLKNALISGSPINTAYKKYKAVIEIPDKTIGKLKSAYYKLSAEQKKDKSVTEVLEKEMDKADMEKQKVLSQFVVKNPGSYFSLMALQQIGGSYFDVAKIEPLFAGLSPQLRNSKEGLALAASIAGAKATVTGKMAPDFAHNDTNGQPVKLSDFKGKYVLLDFWASWCGPCRAENPNVLKAYNTYKNKNFTVLGVSLDQAKDRDKWLKAIKDDGMPWTQLNDSNHTDVHGAGNLYAIKAIPSNFLIDPQGRILAKNLRGEELEKKLAEVLK
ncbi:redoxin domain-containing protein [Pedobacter nutrimenti]|uniref:redoxin domain-containing protein n=1 Tax=Pedobacter nutrimenti TaxID=1241337 RepID=UPI00292DA87A|nr:redoxin domain-containing protein [Pedobacter nutrimenti]